MSSETPPVHATPLTWPVLSMNQRRVLGVLVEKAKTTPEAYPLSLNALVTGSNQKSNRDPVLDLTEQDVEEALAACQKNLLAIKITGGRVERWRLGLYEAWKVDKVELAILAELLLRGPQTEGELRARASRMEPIADLDALRAISKSLAERRLVVYLTEEGRRGTVLTHGFHEPHELERLRALHSSGAATEARPASAEPRARNSDSGLAEAMSQIAELRATVSELQASVADLAGQLKELRMLMATKSQP